MLPIDNINEVKAMNINLIIFMALAYDIKMIIPGPAPQLQQNRSSLCCFSTYPEQTVHLDRYS